MTEREEALVHAALDGELTGDERAELDALLARDEEARRRFASLQRLAGIVEELGSATPPADLSRAVANIVWNRTSTGGPRGRNIEGGAFMARKVLIGLAAAAAVVLVTFAIVGYPPVGKETQGTVGQAQRYQAAQPQLAAKDVKLGDTAAQQFMQTDVFDRLIKDESARKLLSDATVREALTNQALVAGLRDQAAAQLLSDAAVAQLLSNDSVARVLSNDAVAHALTSEASAQALIAAAKAQAVAADGVARAAAADSEMAAAFRDPAVAAALRDQAMVAALRSEAVAQALRSDALIRGLRVDAVRQALNAYALASLRADALRQALRSGALGAALKSEAKRS